MSSSDHLHPQQLQMFMPAKELIALPVHEPDREQLAEQWGEDEVSDEEFWRHKYEESATSTYNYLLDDIDESKQVKEPVILWHDRSPLGDYPRIWEGHHRIAAAYDVNPEMEVPVTYVEEADVLAGSDDE